jgi:hypothetical protein
MSAGMMVQETSTSWKDAHAAQDGDAVPDQVREAVNKGDKAYTSDSDDDSDTSEYYDSESNRLEHIDSEDEFVDAEFEELVSSEGSQEMLRLMLQEQAVAELHEEAEDEAANVIPKQKPVAAELEEEAKDKVQDVILEAKDEVQDVIPEAKDEAQDVVPEAKDEA